jgi:GNAT superfamily N-acetyltransferase
MTPNIRRAHAADIAALTSLVEQYWAFEHIGGFERARIERVLRVLIADPQRGGCWLAEADGAPAGYLVAVHMFSLEYGGMIAEIDEFFVAPEFRGAGTGTALLASFELDSANAGIARVQLQLGVRNDRARGFYERHAYRKRSGYELLEKPLANAPIGRN